MPIAPTHARASVLSSSFFVGRNSEILEFERLLGNEQSADAYSVLAIHGLGGQGKSSLLAQMRELLKKPELEGYPIAQLDFDLAAQRDPVTALITLRNQFVAGGIKTNAFDVAFARHFALTKPGRDIRNDHPELFRFSNEMIGDIVDTANSIFTELPGAKLVYSILTRVSEQIRDWHRRRGEKLLAQLDEIPSHTLRSELPMFLGADLVGHMKDSGGKRPVIFFDTYEALWRGQSRNVSAADTAVDGWVRRLVQESPGALHVMAGRQRLDWASFDPDWNSAITSIDLAELHAPEVAQILDSAKISPGAVRDRIVESSRGHPLTLRVNIRLHEVLMSNGRQPVVEDFPLIAREAFDRLFDHLDQASKAAVRVLSVPRYVDASIWDHLARSGFSMLDVVSRDDLLDEVYFRKAGNDRYLMHELVRDGMIETLEATDKSLLQRVHYALFDYHDRVSSPDPERRTLLPDQSKTSAERDENLSEASDHLLKAAPEKFSQWCVDRFTTDLSGRGSSHRIEMLKRARESLGQVARENWGAAIKLVGAETEVNPFSDEAFELLASALPFSPGAAIDADTLFQLRMIWWRYQITAQDQRAKKVGPVVSAARNGRPVDFREKFVFPELYQAIQNRNKPEIVAEAWLIIPVAEKLDLWSLMAALLITDDEKIKAHYLKHAQELRSDYLMNLLTHLVDVGREFDEYKKSIDFVCEVLRTTPADLQERILNDNDVSPIIRAYFHDVAAQALKAMGVIDEYLGLIELGNKYEEEWLLWFDENPPTEKGIGPCEDRFFIKGIAGNFMQTDFMIGQSQSFFTQINCTNYVWREVDYVRYSDFNPQFFDRREGEARGTMTLNESMIPYVLPGLVVYVICAVHNVILSFSELPCIWDKPRTLH